MKSIVRMFMAAIVFMVVATSCEKEIRQSEKIKEITIDTTIANGTHFYFDLTEYGNEGDVASILEKGNHFSISQLEDETDMFTTVYHYAPALKYTGTDSITLSISQNPAGRAACSKDSTIIYLNILVK